MEKRRRIHDGDQSDNIIEDVEGFDDDIQRRRSNSLKRVGFSIILFLMACYCLYFIASKSKLGNHVSLRELPESRDNNPSRSNILPDSSFVNVNVATTDLTPKVDTLELKALLKTKPIKYSVEPIQEISANIFEDRCKKMIAELKQMKADGIIMEKDPIAITKIAAMQNELRKLLIRKYGTGPYKVEMRLKFPQSMLKEGLAPTAVINVTLAPIEYVPYSVYYFLKVVEGFKGGYFHRNAGHVLQASVNTGGGRAGRESLAFQEYSPKFPHKRLTLGYAGRPGGPEFYISTVDNTFNHGPGSQGSKTEADGCFGSIEVGGADEAVVKRMQTQPGKSPGSGFILSPSNYINIESLRLLQ